MNPNNEEESARRKRRKRRFTAAAAAAVASAVATDLVIQDIDRSPYRGEILRGWSETLRIIAVSDLTCRAQIRMNRNAFFNLCALVKDRGLLTDSQHVSMEEQLCIFLYTIGHNEKNRQLVNIFGRSGQTISEYFNKALDAIIQLWRVFLPPPSTRMPQKIRDSPGQYYPYFKDCIGAIDGTHIPAWVPTTDHPRFRDRCGNISQNVLAACDFDMIFTYVLAGWEGSASDSRILANALNKVGEAKLVVPPGKYYLVDAGFANQVGFLRPYRNVRYHLKEWRNSNVSPTNNKELYNMRHSRLRNVIERAFGLLKSRFKILKNQPEYPYATQVKIVTACFFMHNYITRHGRMADDDEFFAREAAAERTATNGATVNAAGAGEEEEIEIDSDEEGDDAVDWEHFRDDMAHRMWDDWVNVEEEDVASSSE